MSSLTITVESIEEPISLAEAQAHLRVDSDDDADLITALIVAAREYCEEAQGRAYVTRTYEYVVPVASSIELPMPPLVSVESVVSRLDQDNDYAEEEIDADDYEVDSDRTCALVTLDDYPADTEKIIITFTAGYGSAADVPQRIKQTILMLMGHWYEHPETQNVADIPPAVKALLQMDRVQWGV